MKVTMKTKLYLSFLAGLVLLLLSSCSAMPQVSKVEGDERDQVIAAADPIADSIFEGMNQQDYAAFSRDFDPEMKKSLNEKAFSELTAFFAPKIGDYQSREVEKTEMVDAIYVITYNARFEDEEKVTVRLSLRPVDDTYQVAGLWFDSPKLREK
jgi:hypothetical protein